MERPVALLHANVKDGALSHFAGGLLKAGFDIAAPRNTALFLESERIRAIPVDRSPIGFRMDCLSTDVFAALLADPSRAEHANHLHRAGLRAIQLVYADVYAIEDALANPEATPESVQAMIDVGSPALLMAAAMSGRFAVSSPHQFDAVLRALEQRLAKPQSYERARMMLAAEAMERCTTHAAAVATFFRACATGNFKQHRDSYCALRAA